MPDWRTLKVGDVVLLRSIPSADLEQRVSELQNGAQMAGWTADSIERIIVSEPVVTIEEVDEFGAPWYSRTLISHDSVEEHHWLTITHNDSWEYVLRDRE